MVVSILNFYTRQCYNGREEKHQAKMPFDPTLFLQLPLELRRYVYWQLDGQFTKLEPPSKYELFTTSFKNYSYSSGKKIRALENVKNTFGTYIQLFSYLPGFADSWLQFCSCLRYDCIVLDYLRVNREMDGTLALLEWITLDKNIYLALFSSRGVLQVWYSPAEYSNWVDTLATPRTMLKTEHLSMDDVRNVITTLEDQNWKDTVECVSFFQEEELLENESICGSIMEMISMMDTLRGLINIEVTSEHLFERLINFHGTRDHPGQSISYIVKKRVQEIKIIQGEFIGGDNRIADFSRWENLTKLTLSEIINIDLNNILLPMSCKWIVIRNVHNLKWWDQGNLSNLINERWVVQKCQIDSKDFIQLRDGSSQCQHACEHTKMRLVDSSIANREVLFKCKALVWERYGSLNHIQLINIKSVVGDIFIPHSLYYNKRFDTFKTQLRSMAII